ncbi:hypothetical protein ScalyP_jg9469 [Parmales sp. scaly parma]|nr:hypothetical protein ScalyP_jg9469 [Parmales sp. scaly parma]
MAVPQPHTTLHQQQFPPKTVDFLSSLGLSSSQISNLLLKTPQHTTTQYVVVDPKCAINLLRGSDLFSAGVIIASDSITPSSPVTIAVLTDSSGTPTVGTKLSSFDLSSTIEIAVGIALIPRVEMFSTRKDSVAVSNVTTIHGVLPSLGSLPRGKFFPQNLPSAVVVEALFSTIKLDAKMVLDMCAAPGGKATGLASRLKSSAQHKCVVLAVDRSRNKVRNMRALCNVQGVGDKVICATGDSSKISEVEVEVEGEGEGEEVETLLRRWQHAEETGAGTGTGTGTIKLSKLKKESFEAILLDPPCSSLGLRPRILSSDPLNLDQIRDLPKYQRKFVDGAVVLLKSGGYLTYSTCTINPQENEVMVEYILRNFGNVMELVEACVGIAPGDVGATIGMAGVGLSEEERKLCLRWEYGGGVNRGEEDDDDTIGFFLAKFKKKSIEFS